MSDRDPLDALLFDLDGTLLVLERAVRASSRQLRSHGARDGERMRRWWVRSETSLNYAILMAERAGLSRALVPAVRWARALKGISSEHGSHLVDGCRDALSSLSQRVPLGIVTNRNAVDASALLESHGLEKVVSVVVSRSDVWRLKPHPAPIHLAASRLGVSSLRVAMVGDLPVDMRAAKRAGAKAIGVETGLGRRHELIAAGADIVLPSVRELEGWFADRASRAPSTVRERP